MATQFQQWLTEEGYEDLFGAFYAAHIRSVAALARYTVEELCTLFPELPAVVAQKLLSIAPVMGVTLPLLQPPKCK